MKKVGFSFLYLGLLFLLSCSSKPNVVPSLKNWEGDSGNYIFTENSKIIINDLYWDTLFNDATTFSEELFEITGKRIQIVKGNNPAIGDFYLTSGQRLPEIGNEGYILNVDDFVKIEASTSTGIFYGMRTVLQILKQDSVNHNKIAKGSSKDWPDYPLRGLMVDPARRYLSMAFLKGWIKRLSWYKMNMFHIHFTDNQGFRLQCDTYPGLASEEHYTKDDIVELEAYAKKYHVIIVPEVDMPGHATPIVKYNPSLAFDSEFLTHTIDVTSDSSRAWLKALLEEYLPLFSGPYFHIGTDEFPVPYHKKWEDDVLSNCKKITDYQKLKGYAEPMDVFVEFMNWANDIIRAHGKTMRMWHWWDWAPNGIHPNNNIEIDFWEPGEAKDPQWYAPKGYNLSNSSDTVPYFGPNKEGWIPKKPEWYTTKGYKLLNCSESSLYYVPNAEGWIPKIKEYYEGTIFPTSENGNITAFHTGAIPKESCTGGKIQLWGDREYGGATENEITSNLTPWVAGLGEILWGGPRSSSFNDFIKRQKLTGEPPADSL